MKYGTEALPFRTYHFYPKAPTIRLLRLHCAKLGKTMICTKVLRLTREGVINMYRDHPFR